MDTRVTWTLGSHEHLVIGTLRYTHTRSHRHSVTRILCHRHQVTQDIQTPGHRQQVTQSIWSHGHSVTRTLSHTDTQPYRHQVTQAHSHRHLVTDIQTVSHTGTVTETLGHTDTGRLARLNGNNQPLDETNLGYNWLSVWCECETVR